MNSFIFKKQDLKGIAQRLVQHSKDKRVFCFYGEMGAGKTTVIKAILHTLGAKDVGHSPTFGIVNEYHSTNGELLAYHFDFYRLEHEEEAFDLGIEDYLNSEAYVFIEWPERIPNLIPDDVVNVKLQVVDENTRRIDF